MKYLPPLLLLLLLSISCDPLAADNATLTEMIAEREQAMIDKDIETAMSQFSDDATWINAQGYYFEGKDNVAHFHYALTGDTAQDYTYEAGEPKIRVIDSENAIVYYAWKMFWFEAGSPETITFEEIGLMTLTAQRQGGQWRWIAVTNQHTPEFYETIEPATFDES